MAGSLVQSRKKQHALAIPIPGLGHINPLMRFCKRLASEEGFTITFANIEPVHNMIEQANKKEVMTSRKEEEDREADGIKELDIRRVCLPFNPVDMADVSGSEKKFEPFFRALSGLAPHIEELLGKLMTAEPPVTCLISDILMTGPTQAAAQKFNIPRISLQTASLSVLLFTHYILQGAVPLNRVLEVLASKKQIKDDIFLSQLLGLPTLRNADILDFIDENLFLYKVYVETLRETRENSLAIAVNTFEELEQDALNIDFGIPIYAVGPLVEPLDKESSTSMWKEDQDWMKWLDKHPSRSVLYISFGSLAGLTLSQYEEIVAGLLSSKQHFLMVIRPGLLKDVSYMDLSKEIISKSNDKGYTVNWAPQTKVLSHPAIGGFLTHCGWNSTIEALSNGIPMLCFPYIADQFMNAALIKEVWKVGLGFHVCEETGLIKRIEVERVVKLLMQQEEGGFLHENAKYYKKHSIQNGGPSSRSIKCLVNLM